MEELFISTKMGRDSVVGIATVRGSNPGGGKIFRSRPERPWGPPSLLYNGYRVSFPGVKRPGRGVDHSPPSSDRVKERVELYLYSPSGPSWPVLGRIYLYLLECAQYVLFVYLRYPSSAQDVHRTDSRLNPITDTRCPLHLSSVSHKHEPIHTTVICSCLQRADVTAVWLAKHTWRISQSCKTSGNKFSTLFAL
jgi:hypothetical protein